MFFGAQNGHLQTKWVHSRVQEKVSGSATAVESIVRLHYPMSSAGIRHVMPTRAAAFEVTGPQIGYRSSYDHFVGFTNRTTLIKTLKMVSAQELTQRYSSLSHGLWGVKTALIFMATWSQ